ncbi:MAG: 3-chlorobenzoate-3 4-dioxygenase dihydrogenase related protein [Limisphaerales bacterium]|nr:MAG: 3-chlorobenzoate-3 4-dioxygenase dihydrogenase related protein [Limisphaerales bacterium]KAG0508205.1 MAG: 3-chlorobenzoate-3 4-dioxygenase dihydrogenase related protein [Limisphaerales bacterium]TXT51698.1 MAG: 3-chlorobenzoate-3 4-dioxygenase dihydrogenase related protein [Limisphaerales bacterium]
MKPTRRQFLGTVATSSLALAARGAGATPHWSVAVIGHTGRGDYGHGLDTMWEKLPETQLMAVADADAKGLAAAQKKLNVTRGFTDYRKMLAEVKPDIVAIGMRHVDQHRDVALAVAASGARGIYIEKPFCRTPAEADEIVAACEKHNVKLAVAHRNRWHPVLPAIDKLVKDGAIGRLLELRVRGKEDARGGSLDLWVLGSHLLNLICYFGGQPLGCSATVSQAGKPITRADVKDGAEGLGPLAGNEVHARFDMERGIPAYFDSVATAGDRAAGFGLQLIGTKGIIDLRVDQDPVAHYLAGNPHRPVKEPRAWQVISTAGIGQPEPVADISKQVMAHLVSGRDLLASIRENRQPLCSARDGRTTVEMIAAVFESHRLQGQRIAFPLTARDNPLTRL